MNDKGHFEYRVGVLGGSFNPVHLGHLVLAQEALDKLRLERMIWIPCARPPHKPSAALCEGIHRLAMLKLALADDPRMEVSDLELCREGISYTVDTIQALAAQRPDSRLFFLIGGDTLHELHTWKDLDGILACCEIVTMLRPGHHRPAPRELPLPLDQAERLLEHIFSARAIDIASTELRERLAQGASIRYLTPRPVEDYIMAHRLYGVNREIRSSKH